MNESSQGRTFWDWVHGEHPTLNFIGYSIIAIIFAYVIVRYLGFAALAVLVGSVVLFYVILKSIFSITESNLLFVLSPDTPTRIGVHMIGSKRWKNLVLTHGDLIPFTTSAGTHALFVTSYDGQNITASWIHRIGRTEFLMKSSIYEESIKIAEECYSQLTLIRNIPYLVGTKIAGMAINVYEKEKLSDISSLDPKENIEDVLEILRKIKDPIETLKEDFNEQT